MARKLAAILALVASAGAATGCATGDLQRKVDDLTREREDLERQKAQVEADLLACKARCEALERRAAAPAPRAPGVTSTPYEVPGELQGKVDIRRRGDDTVIGIPGDVFFASGSSVLSAAGERTMGQVVAYIRKHHPGATLRVEGHSDTDPIRRTRNRYHCNWELSFERAHAVLHYLIEKGGFDPRQVVCEAYGEYHPQDAANKSRNRRVEIVVARP